MRRSRRRTTALATSIGLLLNGCYTTTQRTERVVHSATEHRTRLERHGALLSGEWRAEGKLISGRVTWQSCRNVRAWVSADARTTRRDPNTKLGTGLLVSGLLVWGVSLSSYDPHFECRERFTPVGPEERYEPCHYEPNLIAALGIVAGATAVTLGLVPLLSSSKTTVEETNHEQHRVAETGSCVPAQDLRELLLVLKVAGDQLVSVQVTPEGTAQVRVPAGVEVPEDVELPIIAYRVPRGARDIMSRGKLVGTLRLTPEVPQAPKEPLPLPSSVEFEP